MRSTSRYANIQPLLSELLVSTKGSSTLQIWIYSADLNMILVWFYAVSSCCYWYYWWDLLIWAVLLYLVISGLWTSQPMHTLTLIASSSWIFAYLDVLLVIVPIYVLYSLENLVHGPYYAYSTYLHSIRLETQKLRYKNMPYWAQESCRGNPKVLMEFSHALALSERLSLSARNFNPKGKSSCLKMYCPSPV